MHVCMYVFVSMCMYVVVRVCMLVCCMFSFVRLVLCVFPCSFVCRMDGWTGWKISTGCAKSRAKARFHRVWRLSASGLQRGAAGCFRSFQHLAGVASTQGGCFCQLHRSKRILFLLSPWPLLGRPPCAPVKADFCMLCASRQVHADCPLGPGLARDGTACTRKHGNTQQNGHARTHTDTHTHTHKSLFSNIQQYTEHMMPETPLSCLFWPPTCLRALSIGTKLWQL